ncbi:hypothetical protein H7F10_06000 [Acidithiobacillus sp. HP-6]|uniref:hypothetical protein n=1 Tax=unclassified Acidithiobacillus TaxID=2614800 RepID=UPI00187B0AB5|nr:MULTISPECIES: hypothetical protein [unclassified Acidithiobacillus]MBE7562509.1 hypothetical protein [Acidithiobacillus sp. HP-6]MBE7568008.1 hypothetical protein [Acidithiobacillus sp. HP-2]
MDMKEDAMIKALDAIHDEALRLLSLTKAEDKKISEGLELIVSIARHRVDVRQESE